MSVRKYIPLFVLMLSSLLSGQSVNWTPESRKLEIQQINLWRDNLSTASSKSKPEKLEFLSKGLRNMGHRSKWNECNPDVIRVYKDIQQEMLAIEGHAKYFADLIIRGQRNPSEPPIASVFRGYESTRFEILYHILPHLPSPETIWVYGNFLKDEKDTTKEPRYPMPQANCDLAINGLRKIGLRGFSDIEETARWDKNHMDNLDMWRTWWKGVKSGKQAFSFEGQNVEYRFKPDGTWTEGPLGSTKRSDRATHSINGGLRSAKQGVSTEETEGADRDARKQPGRMQWLLAGLLVLLGIGFYIFKIRR